MMHSNLYFNFILVLLTTLQVPIRGQVTPWQNMGPFMGYINDLSMDPEHPDTLYAATPTGVFRSVDGADNWTKAGLDGKKIFFVEVSPSHPARLLASTDTSLFVSYDYGGTWTLIWNSNSRIGAIAIDPENSTEFWVGIDIGGYKVYEPNLYHSSDSGIHWEAVPFMAGEELKLSTVEDIHFDRSDPSVIYMTGWGDTYHVDGGLFVSHDRGETWTNFRPGGCSSNNVLAATSTPSGYEPHAAYIIVNACDIDKKVFRSLDYGNTWEELWNPFDITLHRQAGDQIEVDLEDSRYLMVGGYDRVNHTSLFFYNSETDKWYFWEGSPHSYPTAILSHQAGTLLGFKSNGIYQNKVEEWSQWEQKNRGMADVEILDLAVCPADPDKLLVATEGNLASTQDGGGSWIIEGSSFVKLARDPQDTSLLFTGPRVSSHTFLSPFYVYKSTNGGKNWQSMELFRNSGMLDYYYTLWIGDILAFPGQPDKMLMGVDGGGGCGEGLYLTTDGGDSWDQVFSTGVSALALDPSDNEVVYLGTTGLGYVHHSEDGGATWNSISPGFQEAFTGSVRDLAVDKNGIVLAATSSGIFRWEGGEQWVAVEKIPEANIPAILVDNHQADDPIYYAGTETGGIRVSTDGGITWGDFNEGLRPVHVTRLDIAGTGPRYLFAGTADGGVWRTEIPVYQTRVPGAYGIIHPIRIHPNPNQGRFYVTTDEASELRGSLKVINLMGEVVWSEPVIHSAAGVRMEISLDHVPPGCYLLLYSNKQSTAAKIFVVTGK